MLAGRSPVDADDGRRLSGPGEPAAGRWIVESVHLAPTRVRPGNRFGNGEVRFGDHLRLAAAMHRVAMLLMAMLLMIAFVQGDHAFRNGGRRSDTGHGIPDRGDGDLHHPGVPGGFELSLPAGRHGDLPQRREALFVAAVVERIAVRPPAVDPHALHPGRVGQGGALCHDVPLARIEVQRDQVLPLSFRNDVGKPPAVGREGGLEYRRIRISRDQPLVFHRAAGGIDPGGLQPRAVPGHLRLVPLDPGDPLAVGMPGRLHVEIGAAHQVHRPSAALAVDQGDDVYRFTGMDVQHPLSIR